MRHIEMRFSYVSATSGSRAASLNNQLRTVVSGVITVADAKERSGILIGNPVTASIQSPLLVTMSKMSFLSYVLRIGITYVPSELVTVVGSSALHSPSPLTSRQTVPVPCSQNPRMIG